MLSAEDKKRSTGYEQARVEMIEMFTAKNNIERILGMTEKRKIMAVSRRRKGGVRIER